jgi:hypothetical protein
MECTAAVTPRPRSISRPQHLSFLLLPISSYNFHNNTRTMGFFGHDDSDQVSEPVRTSREAMAENAEAATANASASATWGKQRALTRRD